jgi:hypothetical protein
MEHGPAPRGNELLAYSARVIRTTPNQRDFSQRMSKGLWQRP